ncbi:hypothetical protein EAL2_808p05270 (plasmid) [Peptoclostridium acidaminophilum DSM 3953]|uniref:V-type ATP synthase subunit F n=1 Tax=Peptoclostridium acidaminophilum DSM 3953 TaxID=1286171 RepID=W8TAY3_PEPAC|nr:V-type ATP synthase subunit F [Peptoclostridium acidaminophilum]AHM58030.1 hypothetical protein EAL2_808p05270 [Peptoclostridium acidaminophilum DSM 3953]
MYKVAVLGDRESIYGFVAIGLETFQLDNAEDGADRLKMLIEERYAVIYITEKLHEQLEELIESYNELPLPVIIQIPGLSGNTGKGMLSLKKTVIRAVGSDVTLEKE